jgi:hypothetical protein
MSEDIFEGSVSRSGSFAAAFESDADTAYFYVYRIVNPSDYKVIGEIRMGAGNLGIKNSEIAVRWDAADEKVGLFIRGTLWAVFEISSGKKYGGNYRVGGAPQIPPEAQIQPSH